jgi:tRNA pseudouridine55 synthase
VAVYRLEVLWYDYPELTLAVECGSGTYVRSLGRDLAERLGTAAVMSALRRTAIGAFHLDQAVEPHALTPESLDQYLLPPLRAVESLPRVELSGAEIARVRKGLPIAREALPAGAEEIAAVDEHHRLVAILTAGGPGLLRPLRNLPA